MLTAHTTKRCPACSETILIDAKKCKHCNEVLDPNFKSGVAPVVQVVVPQSRTFNPGTAALISIFFPGFGHVYRGSVLLGFGLFLLTFIGYLLIVPGLIIHFIVIMTAALPESSVPNKFKRPSVKRIILGVIGLFLLMEVAVILIAKKVQNNSSPVNVTKSRKSK
jgi:hypothetical protein